MKVPLLHSILQNLDKPFVLNDENSYSYRDLINLLSKLNTLLYYNNYKKVLISVPQGFYAYSSILASYLTNATFCVINQDLPLERKTHVINQFEPDVIFSQANTNFYSDRNIPKVNLESINYHEIENKLIETDFPCFDNEIIYVYFTSGSTGTPKGCRIKRSAVEKLVLWAVKEFKLTSDDIWGQYTPLYFDMSLFDVFGVTCLGASLVSFSTTADKLRPGNLIRKYKITFLNAVPQIIDILNKTGHLTNEYCKSLSAIKLGGDKTYRNSVELLFDIIPDLTVILTYGPTETTIFCTYKKVNKSNYNEYSTDILTIGKPIPECNIKLENMIDGIGEIVVYGECVGLGYIGKGQAGYNSIELHGKPTRSYLTGDFAKKINDCYYFCGRKDSQIKINGQRFYLGEIETTLKIAGCDECAVVFLNNNVIAFYVDHKKQLKIENINEKIKQYIPEIFIPKQYISIEQMPYNANGKIDRIKLKSLIEDKLYG